MSLRQQHKADKINDPKDPVTQCELIEILIFTMEEDRPEGLRFKAKLQLLVAISTISTNYNSQYFLGIIFGAEPPIVIQTVLKMMPSFFHIGRNVFKFRARIMYLRGKSHFLEIKFGESDVIDLAKFDYLPFSVPASDFAGHNQFVKFVLGMSLAQDLKSPEDLVSIDVLP